MRLRIIKMLTFALVAAALSVIALAACSSDPTPEPTTAPASEPTAAPTATPEPTAEPLLVVTSIYPMQFFAERIAGERAEVFNLVPPGVEAHAFEPTPSDLRRLANANVIAMNGLEMEPWLERAIVALGNDVKAIVVEAASEEGALPFVEDAHDHGHGDEEEEGHDDHEDEDEHGDEDDHGHEDEDDHGDEGEGGHDDHGHGLLDPHLWNDPLRAIDQAEAIEGALIEADPNGADFYRANLASLIADLRALHADFETGLASCRHTEFITSHAAYGYLAARYGLEQAAIAGLAPDAEPTAGRLAELTDLLRETGIGAVLVEPVLSGANESALAREAGVQQLPIHALGSVTAEELAEHGDFIGIMRDTLASLRIALECA